mmetsp:Transcript_4295/g.14242  ORF Transcript_4295/g.14242 Transcript_4295/m.14242 type:complete len:257 (+) Transcript_4295:1782-2552(+)
MAKEGRGPRRLALRGLQRREPRQVQVHPRLDARVGLLSPLRPRHEDPLGSSVGHRVLVGFDDLHGILRRFPRPSRTRQPRRNQTKKGSRPGVRNDGRGLGLHLPEGPAAAEGGDARDRSDATGVSVLVPDGPQGLREGFDREPPDDVPLQPRGHLGRGARAVAEVDVLQRLCALGFGEDVEIYGELPDARGGLPPLLGGRREVGPRRGRGYLGGREFFPLAGRRGGVDALRGRRVLAEGLRKTRPRPPRRRRLLRR